MRMFISNWVRCLKHYKNCKMTELKEMFYIHKAIGHLGRIEIEPDKIKCYVSQLAVKKESQELYFILPNLKGYKGLNDKLRKEVDLGKPIQYIFNGLTFNKEMKFWVMSDDVSLYFYQCMFLKDVNFIHGQKVVFDDCKYLEHVSNCFFGNCWIRGQVKDLTIKSDKYLSEHYNPKKHHPAYIGFDMEIKHLKIYSSKLQLGKYMHFFVKSDQLLLENTELTAPEVFLETEHFQATKVKINAPNGIILDFKSSKMSDCEFDTPVLIMNGKELFQEPELEQVTSPSKQERVFLLGVLRELYKKCRTEQARQNSCQIVDNVLKRKRINED